MTDDARAFHRSRRPDDFIVVSCPIDALLQHPMYSAGARFGQNEVLNMILEFMLPNGIELMHRDKLYLFYQSAMYVLDDDGYVIDDEPTMVVEVNQYRHAVWKYLIGENDGKGQC